MTRIASTPPREPGAPPPDDPFRYGWRFVKRLLPDGRVEEEQVPLTLEDVLHPKEGDVIPENTQQERDRRYLHDVLERRYADDPHTLTLSDCIINWGVRGVRNHSPDITVVEGVRDKAGPWGVFSLRRQGGRPVLVAEIVSPHTRANDVDRKPAHYHRAGVPFYLIVDQEEENGPRALVAYEYRRDGYVAVTPDAEGRVPLGKTGILVGLEGGRLVCRDPATGQELGDYTHVCRQLEHEIAAREAAEKRAERESRRADREKRRADKAEEARRALEEELRRLRNGQP